MAGLRYIVNKNLGISSHYDSDMGFGVGVTLVYDFFGNEKTPYSWSTRRFWVLYKRNQIATKNS